MLDKNINFITFDEAVDIASSKPGIELIGLEFDEPFSFLRAYTICANSEEPDYINIFYDGGLLFSTCGEEEIYDLDDVPTEAKKLFYARKTDLGNGDPQISGMVSEYVLQELLPGLASEDDFRSKKHFAQAAGAKYRSYWRQS